MYKRQVYDRIDEVEDQVKAYITLDKENALAQAAKVDKMIADGETIKPLAGIPGAIKDNISVKGVRMTCASKILENFVPVYDAHVIENLRKDETIFLGKTNMDEFAMGSTTETSHFQITHNPWDLTRVPGGSSGGSAASIAAGEAIWSLGSDTGGSIRQPAFFNGCVGLKPTYGRVSRYGCVAFASSLDQVGPITRDVTDAALVLNTISGLDAHDSTSYNAPVPDYTKALRQDVKDLTIGLPKEYFGEGTDPKVAAQIKLAAKKFEELGAHVIEVSLPHTEYAVITYYIADAFKKCDLLLTPTSPVVAYPLDAKMDPLTVYMLDVTTIPVNMAGLPGISIPCGFVDNMPVGAQLIGKALGEETLLRAAYTFEQATDFHKAVAPLGGLK